LYSWHVLTSCSSVRVLPMCAMQGVGGSALCIASTCVLNTLGIGLISALRCPHNCDVCTRSASGEKHTMNHHHLPHQSSTYSTGVLIHFLIVPYFIMYSNAKAAQSKRSISRGYNSARRMPFFSRIHAANACPHHPTFRRKTMAIQASCMCTLC
jgi:hypothetical protein